MYCHYHISEILMYGCNFVGSIEFVCLSTLQQCALEFWCLLGPMLTRPFLTRAASLEFDLSYYWRPGQGPRPNFAPL